jgi:hypothetical protein
MKKKTYWFRPKRFWGWFAAYYPVSREGWTIALAALFAVALIFSYVDRTSHSASDTLIGSAPGIIIVMLMFDLICFRTGEYPNWWKTYEKSQD